MNRLRDRLQFFVWLLVLALAAVARVDAAAGAQPVVILVREKKRKSIVWPLA